MELLSKVLAIVASNSIFVGKINPSLKLVHSDRQNSTFTIPSTIQTGDIAVVIGGGSVTSPDGIETVAVGSPTLFNFTNATNYRTAATTGTAYGITLMFSVLQKPQDAGRTALSVVSGVSNASHTLAIFRYCYDDFTVAAPIDPKTITYSAANVPTTGSGIVLSIPGTTQNTENYVLNLAGGWGTLVGAPISISAPNMTAISPSVSTASAMSYQIYKPNEMPVGYDAFVTDTGSQLGADIQFIIPIPGA